MCRSASATQDCRARDLLDLIPGQHYDPIIGVRTKALAGACSSPQMFESDVLMRKKVRNRRARYAVGDGCPLTSSQFQPGQSGNPQGRPKGVRNASSMARAALERTIKVNGKKRQCARRHTGALPKGRSQVTRRRSTTFYHWRAKSIRLGLTQAETERSAADDLVILQ